MTTDIELPDDFGSDSPLAEQPYISIDPAIQGGAPCLNHTRMTVETIAYVWWGGDETLESMIKRKWPVRSKGELVVACWYVGTYGYGNTIWRKRWGWWARKAFDGLWNNEYERVPLPPRKGEA